MTSPPAQYLWLAGAWLAFIVYGSLMPFDFDAPWPADAGPVSLVIYWVYLAATGPRWWDHATLNLMNNLGESSILGDYLTNVMLYFPVGVLLRLRMRELRRAWWRQILEPALMVLLVCWAVECTQGMVASRLASYNDIVANASGGLIGALLGAWGDRTLRGMMFWCYCRVSHVAHDIGAFVDRQREKPVMLVVVTLVNVVFFLVWWKLHLEDGKAAGARPINWMPFKDQFSYPYEVAVAHLGRSMILYVVVAMLLSLQFLSMRRRKGVGVMVLVVALLAALHEVLRAMTAGRRADITEPLVATIAVVGVVYLAYLSVNSVRLCCRRRASLPVKVERRRRPHAYAQEEPYTVPTPGQG